MDVGFSSLRVTITFDQGNGTIDSWLNRATGVLPPGTTRLAWPWLVIACLSRPVILSVNAACRCFGLGNVLNCMANFRTSYAGLSR